MYTFLPHIPREFTALAEWIACIILILSVRKRYPKTTWMLLALLFGIGQLVLQLVAGILPINFWILGMFVNIAWMHLTIAVLTDTKPKVTIFLSCKAFIASEFVSSLSWQVYTQFIWQNTSENYATSLIFTLITYSLLFFGILFIEKRNAANDTSYMKESKEVIAVVLMVIIIFTMSNIGFLVYETAFNFGSYVSIFFIRTLVNFSGMCMLYLLQTQKQEQHLRKEISSINNVLQHQYEQYLAFREGSTILEHKYHDFKHQVDVIRNEDNKKVRDEHLSNLMADLSGYSSKINSGNAILDTILTQKNRHCLNNGIKFTCMTDGKLLNFLETMDLCSIFGNSLDNAIEAVGSNVKEHERVINLKIYQKNKFIIIRLENYYDSKSLGKLRLIDGLPRTSKSDRTNHGYGLKSIKYIIEKYDGTLSVVAKDNWFTLKILLPTEKNPNPNKKSSQKAKSSQF